MFQRFECIGHLGGDAELRQTQSGQTLLSFSVACTEKWKDRNDEWQEKTFWARCTLWGEVAERLDKGGRMVKGALVHVQDGSLEEREYEDRDGVAKKSTQVKVRKVRVLKDAEGNEKRSDREDEDDRPRRRENGGRRSRSNSGRDTRRTGSRDGARGTGRSQREPVSPDDDDPIPF